MTPPRSPTSPPTARPADAGARPRRGRRKEARPGELIDAALDLFVEKGFAATRVEEVAQRAGVSKGTLFLYFPTKEDLFKAVVRENISGRFEEWNSELATFEGSSAELLRYAMNQWWERVGLTRASGITKLVMAEARNFPGIAEFYQAEVIGPGHTLIRRILQRGVDAGEFRALDLDHATYSVVAPMIFLILWKHAMAPCLNAAGQLVPADYLAAQADVILSGLLARPGSPRPPKIKGLS